MIIHMNFKMLNHVNKSKLYRFLFLNDNTKSSYTESGDNVDINFDKLNEENAKILHNLLLSDENFKESYTTTHNEKDMKLFSEILANTLSNFHYLD